MVLRQSGFKNSQCFPRVSDLTPCYSTVPLFQLINIVYIGVRCEKNRGSYEKDLVVLLDLTSLEIVFDFAAVLKIATSA